LAFLDGMKRSVLKLDSAGRLVLPKPLRTRLGLRPGSQLEVTVSDGDIQLHPIASGEPLVSRVGGWLVHCGQAEESLEDAVAIHRARRLRSLE
jgi:AbrB family looped-hinge helix DNA binding protein